MPKIDTLIIIPAHNEAALVGDTVRDILNATQLPVVVVDDASTDDTATKARNAGAQLIPLATQLGAWGATQTGLRYALKNGYRNVVTIDADGQHDAQSINHLLTTMRSEDADLVIGSCTHRGSTARKTAWSLLRALSGLTMRDLTSGFRVYSHKGISLLAGRAATSLDYQDIGVLCLMNNAGMKIIETDVCMYPRADGKSRIFHSWLAVSQYMLYSAILAVSHMKHTKKR